MWIALRINTFLALFEPFGPFSDERRARAWVEKQKSPREFAVLEIKKP